LLYFAATTSKKPGIVFAAIAYIQAWLDEEPCHSLIGINGQLIRQRTPCMYKAWGRGHSEIGQPTAPTAILVTYPDSLFSSRVEPSNQSKL